jgi:hypothetical protein
MHRGGLMRTRRAFLATGLGLLIVSAGQRARAVGVEAEGAVYGGQTSGGWICGPVGTAHYAGVGTQVTVTQRERADPAGRGFVVDFAGGGEHTAVTAVQPCSGESCADAKSAELPDRLMLGGRVRGGYEWRYVGVEGGLGVYQGWANNQATDPPLGTFSPALQLYPDLSVSFGKLHRIYGIVGFGTPLVTQLLRPGLYGGFGVAGEAGFGLDFYGGVFRQGPAPLDAAGARFDLVGRAPIPGTKNLYLRAGGSLGSPENGPLDWEGSLGLSAGY